MLYQKYVQNGLLMLLAVYLIKARVDPLSVFSTDYYNKHPKLSKIVQNVIKAAHTCICILIHTGRRTT